MVRWRFIQMLESPRHRPIRLDLGRHPDYHSSPILGCTESRKIFNVNRIWRLLIVPHDIELRPCMLRNRGLIRHELEESTYRNARFIPQNRLIRPGNLGSEADSPLIVVVILKNELFGKIVSQAGKKSFMNSFFEGSSVKADS